MVSAGISNTDIKSIDSGAKVSNGRKSTSADTDFTKVLEQQADDKGLVHNDKKNPNPAKNDTVKEIIQKSFSMKEKNPAVVNVQEEEITEEMTEAVSAVFVNIVTVIAEQLNLEPEQVMQAISELQVEAGDLLDMNTMNQIVKELTGMESVLNILTDTELSETMKHIYAEVDTLVKEFETNFGTGQELLAEMLDDVKVVSVMDHKADEVVMSVPQPETDISEETQTVQDGEVSVVEQEVTDISEADSGQTNPGQDKNSQNPDTQSSAILTENRYKSDSHTAPTGETVNINLFEGIRETVVERIAGEDNGLADRIIRQITDHIKMYARQDTTALEIQLEPESLGKVSLTVAAKAGSVTAHLIVQNEVAKEAIESQVSSLKETMNQQGIKIEAIEVTVASKEFEENLDRQRDTSEQQEQKRRKHLSADELAEINGITVDDEDMKEEIMKEMGNTVSYTA